MMPRPKTGGVNPMKLKSLCSLKTGYVTADFWVVRRGSIESLGKPTRNFNPEHIGVKVERSDIVIEKWLFLGNNFEEMLGLLVIFFVMHYTDCFLSLKEYYPRVSKITKYGANFAGVLFIAALFLRKYEWFFGFSYVFSKLFLSIISLTLYFFAYKLARKKNLMGYYFLIAYSEKWSNF